MRICQEPAGHDSAVLCLILANLERIRSGGGFVKADGYLRELIDWLSPRHLMQSVGTQPWEN